MLLVGPTQTRLSTGRVLPLYIGRLSAEDGTVRTSETRGYTVGGTSVVASSNTSSEGKTSRPTVVPRRGSTRACRDGRRN